MPDCAVYLMEDQTAENSLKALKKEADERLLIEAAQQDPARFAELYEINFERVYAYVVRRVGNRTETEDLTSEVFHQALANLRRFEWRGIPYRREPDLGSVATFGSRSSG